MKDTYRTLEEPIDIIEVAAQLNKKVFDTGVAAERERVLALVDKAWRDSDDATPLQIERLFTRLRAAIESGKKPEAE